MENNEQKKVQGMNEATFAGLMNFISLFASFGWIISIVLWAIGKDESKFVDQWGKELINWLISCVIYSVVLGIVAVIGIFIIPFLIIPILAAFALFMLVCPIIAGVKALNHETWNYPLAIKFIK